MTRSLGLAGSAAPALGHDRGGDYRDQAAQQQRPMACPHPPLAALGGDQRPGVVGDPGHADRRAPAGRVTLAAHSSASASSRGHIGACRSREALARSYLMRPAAWRKVAAAADAHGDRRPGAPFGPLLESFVLSELARQPTGTAMSSVSKSGGS
ncbi:MAG: hypothetical protein ACYCPF_07845 [Streptosporangiaceae bacterium]